MDLVSLCKVSHFVIVMLSTVGAFNEFTFFNKSDALLTRLSLPLPNQAFLKRHHLSGKKIKYRFVKFHIFSRICHLKQQ